MSMDLTGIVNENEFYTHHYLSAILENDLKDLFASWRKREEEENIRSPYAELRGQGRDYFVFLNNREKERRPEVQLELQREFLANLITVLGYNYSFQMVELDDDTSIPLLAEIKRPNGSPELWIIESFDLSGENLSPLDLPLSEYQISGETDDSTLLFPEGSLEDIITKQVFGQTEPPRWVILANHSQLVLIDRSKWNQKCLLRFDLQEILSRRENTTLQAMSALLHCESVCPPDGLCLLDTLDESSHKHAFSVSEDLKYALRRSIELLGNEAVYYLREKMKEKVYDRELAGQLTLECLRYMYRLLFMFYIEARPELGYAPIKADAYLSGYSLETLRDLELVNLTTPESRDGTFICESLNLLFDMIYNGFSPSGHAKIKQAKLEFGDSPQHHVFTMSPLKSHLFDPDRTPLLNRVKFRNCVLQEVIQQMSLTRPKNRRERRGRISYAQLGINQLGAVYEALLSYQGFFAETDLYEVKKAGEQWNELNTAYFVKEEDLEKYTEEERVYNENGTFKKYIKGTFIYRLAGRDREKSASYYTPEVLTQCLVKYALKELLKDKTADEILKLTVCEPAMGSAAFLNEAVNQLAEAYLQLKQKELNQTIPHDQYEHEKQKVKMLLADNNVFGVDLNPVAVELAEVSLWLNTIHEGGFVPWFGMQLVCGNSLIGARRQVFDSGLLKRSNKSNSTWLDEVPERVMPGEKRPDQTVYHFLLPDKGMADYKDKVIRDMAKDEIEAIKDWRKDFTRLFSEGEINQLEKLSNAIDKLWDTHTKLQGSIRERTTDPLYVFGQSEPDELQKFTTTGAKDRVFNQEVLSQDVRASSHYRRLKLAMDYWCALWFWPIEKADLLPSREEFMLDLSLILEGNVFETKGSKGDQLALFPETQPKQLALQMLDEFGFVDVDKLCQENERLKLVCSLAEKYRYLHWELEFADLFVDRGGFDLVVGNPPWIKVEWNEGGILGDYEPLFIIRKYSAADLTRLRKEVISKYDICGKYLEEHTESGGTQNFLNALQNYPLLKGSQSNLFKCFLPGAWYITKTNGHAGFLHPEGVYDDPGGGELRQNIYPRLRYHFQFQNALNLFPDVAHREKFSINIYVNKSSDSFIHISNLFHPSTIDMCFEHNGMGICYGIKDDNSNWNMKGHKDRLIFVSPEVLTIFAKIYDKTNTPMSKARLPVIHSKQIINVLAKFAFQKTHLGDLKDQYVPTEMWHETNSQSDGIIKRDTTFVTSDLQLILSGPHMYVGNPIYKTPRRICREKADYDVVDLNEIEENYLPRTNYLPACDSIDYQQKIQKVPWPPQKPITEYSRFIARKMLPPPNERTLIGAIYPKGPSHTSGCFSLTLYDNKLLCLIAGAFHSLVFDFYIKTTGKTNFTDDLVKQLPIINKNEGLLILRSLMLNCLTKSYAEIWDAVWEAHYKKDYWTKNDLRLNKYLFANLTPNWQRNCALRTDYERRQALIEIDVLTAMAIDLTLDELCSIYRIQFPVLRQNENDTWYDQNGRIVFTCSKGLPGVGFSRPEWNEIKDMRAGTVKRKIIDDTMLGGPRERTIVYEAPFDRCDREKDYEIAWAEFERRFKEKEASN